MSAPESEATVAGPVTDGVTPPAPALAGPAPRVPDPEPPTPGSAAADPDTADLAAVDATPAVDAGRGAPHEAKPHVPRSPARTTSRPLEPPAPATADGHPATTVRETPQEDPSGGAGAP